MRGDLVLILSAHAVPVDEHWVERMTAPFEDPRVAGVASRQRPWDDAPWREVLRLARQFGPDPARLPPASTDELVFSNAASCIRRSAWRDQPFLLPAAEDLEWARRVVAAGWSVIYEPGCRRLPLPSRGRPRPGAAADRHQSRGRRRGAGAHAGAGRSARRPGSSTGTRARSSASTSRSAASSRTSTELVRIVSYYVVDFSRAGTTAERRRADS